MLNVPPSVEDGDTFSLYIRMSLKKMFFTKLLFDR